MQHVRWSDRRVQSSIFLDDGGDVSHMLDKLLAPKATVHDVHEMESWDNSIHNCDLSRICNRQCALDPTMYEDQDTAVSVMAVIQATIANADY